MEAAQSMWVTLQTRTDASVGQTLPRGGRPISSLLRVRGCGRNGVGGVERRRRRKNLLQILPTASYVVPRRQSCHPALASILAPRSCRSSLDGDRCHPLA